MAVSWPFITPSLQVGAWQVIGVPLHTPSRQSEFAAHAVPSICVPVLLLLDPVVLLALFVPVAEVVVVVTLLLLPPAPPAPPVAVREAVCEAVGVDAVEAVFVAVSPDSVWYGATSGWQAEASPTTDERMKPDRTGKHVRKLIGDKVSPTFESRVNSSV
jgi:hypothetical protein